MTGTETKGTLLEKGPQLFLLFFCSAYAVIMANLINTAYIEGDGFSMNLTIPQKIIRKDYLINVSSNEVIIRLEGKTYVRTLLTNNVTGEFIKGKNRVMNYNGQIRITEAT